MKQGGEWSRRQFMEAAAAAWTVARVPGKAQTGAARSSLPPEVLAGKVQALMEAATAQPMRYLPHERGFVIRNGSELFNRPLYGPNNGFRVDAGDLPEFSLYLPGHGGNLRLGICVQGRAKWLAQAESVETRYIAGRMEYAVRDTLLGAGELRLEVLTAAEGSGLLLRAEGRNLPGEVALSWAFGGVSGRKGKRGGDIGCENEPVARFFRFVRRSARRTCMSCAKPMRCCIAFFARWPCVFRRRRNCVWATRITGMSRWQCARPLRRRPGCPSSCQY